MASSKGMFFVDDVHKDWNKFKKKAHAAILEKIGKDFMEGRYVKTRWHDEDLRQELSKPCAAEKFKSLSN